MTDGADLGVRFGILCWNQYTDWESLEQVGRRIDELGYHSLWTWDHLYPIVGSDDGPIFEGWMTLAAWAKVTQRVKLGLMVGANTFRNPALTAKMATTLDHISGGRAYLGIGGAWFRTEHTAYGLDFGSGFGERLDRLDEAVRIMRGMLRGEEPSGSTIYATKAVRNDPPPLKRRLPILIGGGGERKTLATTARYADAWNVGGSVEKVRRKDAVLRRWCQEVGRDESEIERTLGSEFPVLRDDPAAAASVAREINRAQGGSRDAVTFSGTPEHLAELLVPYVELGFRHIYFDQAAPWDDETLERLMTEVRPMVETRAGAVESRA
jgi:alkanesulfonate monooxygenase SsuD/methylene tetrahydromethanopterin reductase-like flavin-dependent oxidoreductase (luciferase family)